jgi:hypothetical protein
MKWKRRMRKMSESESKDEAKQLPVQVFQEMDRRDEAQILQEMRGELLREFVYSIRIDGRDVTNLSYAGIKEAIRRHGQIEILEVRKEEDDREYRVLVRVRDHVHSIDVLGAATAEKNKPFAWVLAHNKAERNAFSKLLPAKLYATLIEEWLTQYRGKARAEAKDSGTPKQSESPIPKELGPTGPTTPETGSLASFTDEKMVAELEKPSWRPNKSGKGWNIRWEELPQQVRAALGLKLNEVNERQYVKLGDYSYRRFGETGDWLARYPRKEGMNAGSNASITKASSKEPDKSWRVPVTANQATPAQAKEGLRQFPLLKGLKSFGMVNILNDEISIVPEHPVAKDSTLIDGFLIARIVEPLIAKHQLSYTVKVASNGSLEGILIRGKLQDEQVKELVSGARWAFERCLGLEEKKT